MILLYKILMLMAWPIVSLYMIYRKKKGKEDIARFNERIGKPSKIRPEGDILWMHGASVGETISMLSLIDKYLATYPNLHIMVTSGTKTSAALLADRLPKRAFHQYIPVDNPIYTKRFVKYWKPTGVLWFESDFWPSILSEISNKKIPLALVNGRISDRSFRGWKKYFPGLINNILEMFNIQLGQSEDDAERIKVLGGKNVYFEGNLKFAAQPLSFDKKELSNMQKQLNGRKLFLIASTHHNEEERFIKIYQNLKNEIPDLLIVISPRHFQRADAITEAYQKAGINIARRSKGENITSDTEAYLFDTWGELGLTYKLCPIVYIGGSLIPHGGQNFLECLHFSDAVVAGPHMHNFRMLMKLTLEGNAVIQKDNDEGVEEALKNLLIDDNFLTMHRENADKFIKSQNNVLDVIFKRIETEIKV